jgi:hypothetical protein
MLPQGALWGASLQEPPRSSKGGVEKTEAAWFGDPPSLQPQLEFYLHNPQEIKSLHCRQDASFEHADERHHSHRPTFIPYSNSASP